MICEKCKKEYPSKYYFKTPTVCNYCYDPKNDEEKRYVEQKEKSELLRTRKRSLIFLFNVTILTFGLYLIYWYYQNMKEIRSYFALSSHKIFKTAKVLYFILLFYGVIIILYFTVKIETALLSENSNSSDFLIFYIPIIFLSTIFIYYFTCIISIGQEKSGIDPIDVHQLFSYYVGSSMFTFLGTFLPFASLLGLIFAIIYYYKAQQELNKIWQTVTQLEVAF